MQGSLRQQPTFPDSFSSVALDNLSTEEYAYKPQSNHKSNHIYNHNKHNNKGLYINIGV
jgi:hypothetical protein